MRILAVETSCDETAIALVEATGGLNLPTGGPSFKTVKNLVASQIKIHAPFGGVVPSLAKREHIKNLPKMFGKIFRISNFQFPISNEALKAISHKLKADLIAVTVGPGLEPALWTGISFAKQLYENFRPQSASQRTNLKLVGTSHLDGHLYSFLLQQKSASKKSKVKSKKFEFPAIALIVSGGHTILIKMDSLTKYKKIGETVDDAVGEAFDKVARLLGLPYPGGPEIEKLAKFGSPTSINFPRPMLNQKNYNFSFSGLKTSVLYYLRDNRNNLKANVAASFQAAAFDVLIKKTLRAADEFNAKSIFLSGGVSANKTLQKEFKKAINSRQLVNNKEPNKKRKKIITNYQLLITKFPTDNAAMIAAAAYINQLRKKKYKLEANGNLDI